MGLAGGLVSKLYDSKMSFWPEFKSHRKPSSRDCMQTDQAAQYGRMIVWFVALQDSWPSKSFQKDSALLLPHFAVLQPAMKCRREILRHSQLSRSCPQGYVSVLA